MRDSVYPLLAGNAIDLLLLNKFAHCLYTTEDKNPEEGVILPDCDEIPMLLTPKIRQKIMGTILNL
jgi:hypothetical protein